VAFVLLVVLLPAFALLALAIKLDSRGSVVYGCRRIGKGGRAFTMLKFRKMRLHANGPMLTLGTDARFTRIGRFLAASKLDELPQLWNVLRGEMSLVGPRPEDPEFVALLPSEYGVILRVRPGITGLTQLAFAKESRILDPDDRVGDYVRRLLPQKASIDRLYVDTRTFAMDLRILVWTVVAVLLRRDVAVHRATGALGVRRRPVVDEAASVEVAVGGGLAVSDVILPTSEVGARVRAVVLAGGRGRRLAPYTSVLPKPLMPIGERSILEIVVRQLADHGFSEITLCVGYLSHLIRAVFDQHIQPDVAIQYVYEEEPLGTAGPLRLADGLDDTFVVMNGDLLTTLNYRDLLRHHRDSGNVLTIATHRRIVKIDYGVLYTGSNGNAGQIEAFEEKPEIETTVSMGIYAFEPRALEFIPEATYFDFPDLVQVLLAAGEKVGAYHFDGVWFDIGRQDDYEQAVAHWTTHQRDGATEALESELSWGHRDEVAARARHRRG
jgi:lipopolysaccharide/colanic/teichoic acid biosynthesis glycosyltransferase/dTDP-glucose pyrophosphorylase